MQFLWFYIPGPENGFELRHSIRSVIQNFSGTAKVTVIGERPNWYRGHFIECGRTYRHKRRDRDPFLDTQNKIIVASQHPEIDEEFVWLADDVFFAQPVTIEDLKVPRFDPWFRVRSNREWHRLINATFSVLKAKGKTALQYGTHLPHFCEKQKLVELFQIYNYGPKNLLLWEILMVNHFRTGGIPYGGNWEGVSYPYFLKRLLRRPRSSNQMMEEIGNASVVNWQSNVFSQAAKDWLSMTFPEAAGSEN